MKKHRSKKEPEVYYYLDKNGKKKWCYRHRYYDSLGKRREKSAQGFNSERDCLKALLEVKATILNGETKHVENDKLTVSEWLDIWYETNQNDWEITSRVQRETAIRLQMKPLLGKYKLQKLDKATYKRVFINELLKTYEPSTVELLHRLFKVAVNAAVDNEIIPRNRFLKITIPHNDKKENFLTAEELKEFLSAAKKFENITNYTLIFLLAYTGVRKGEALGLTWNDIDFEKRTISINKTRDKRGVRTPKTKNSYRTILADDLLMKQLATYQTWCKEKKLGSGSKLKGEDFIFISPQSGQPTGDNTVKYCFDRLVKKSGLKRITPHGLRHTHATILIGQRIPVKTIAERLGNTPQMILDIYGHSFKELEEESVQAFSSIINM